MTVRVNKKIRIEFGDFQTPESLADEVCRLLSASGIHPQCIVEPTCGRGNFLASAIQSFDQCGQFWGFELNPAYMDLLQERFIKQSIAPQSIHLQTQNFFQFDWQTFFADLPQPFLVLGNPPWVTNTTLGTLESQNLPRKSNFQNRNGFEAISGKSNFDISEWMLIHLLATMKPYQGTMAMLCKTSVARKVLRHCWNQKNPIQNASIYGIDAKKHFDVNVDACLFVCQTGHKNYKQKCTVYQRLNSSKKISTFGILHSELIADIDKYENLSFLDGPSDYQWRSGVKHDCAKVMEFERKEDMLVNGFGEPCEIEPEMIYPLFKSSDIFHGRPEARKYVLITQKQVGQDTVYIRNDAPKTWQYLLRYADLLEKRKSRIYKNNPRFSIFGIGEYSFAPWKIAISGLYKKIHFSLLEPKNDKPCMTDDTCYFISCRNQKEAELLWSLYNTTEANEFLEAFIFWDSKRPITIDILRRINIRELARISGKEDLYRDFNEEHSEQMVFSF